MPIKLEPHELEELPVSALTVTIPFVGFYQDERIELAIEGRGSVFL